MRLPVAGIATGGAISGVGTGMTLLTIPWLVLATTGSAAHTGAITAAETAGLLIGSAFGAPWIDRLGPHRAAVRFDLAAAPVVTAIPAPHRCWPP
ncbi:hypothetical protein [Saccharopolyspora griseoalba]|uniref:Major facilitator superfamily (MFS) profile domain-containing protein n=1 Tax=Saccharopolyspora griseoalba TaxID=1431848 RepID=A0ABW2LF23_9PSEU